MQINIQGKVEKLEEYKGKNGKFDAEIIRWGERYHFEIKTENNSAWFLVMPMGVKNGAERYAQKFSIEKCFQDQKSSGFNMEKCKRFLSRLG